MCRRTTDCPTPMAARAAGLSLARAHHGDPGAADSRERRTRPLRRGRRSTAFSAAALPGEFHARPATRSLRRFARRLGLSPLHPALREAGGGGRRRRRVPARRGIARADDAARRGRTLFRSSRRCASWRARCARSSGRDQDHLCRRLERIFRPSPAGWQRRRLLPSRPALGAS